MAAAPYRTALAGALLAGLLLAGHLPVSLAQAPSVSSTLAENDVAVTNLAQLCHLLRSQSQLYAHLNLDVIVCAASRPQLGVVIVRDSTSVELLELGGRQETFAPGERLRIAGRHLLLRRRELGAQISSAPTVENDGLHGWRTRTNEIVLSAGRVPFELEWFNGFRAFGLELSWQPPDGLPQRIGEGDLWHFAPGQLREHSRLVPGVQAECFQGYWDQLPDFDLLAPAKTGSATNLDVSFRLQDETVGLRFTGLLQVPRSGRYTFRLSSDDGAMLFLGSAVVPVEKLGTVQPPKVRSAWVGQPMDAAEEQRWVSLAGRVSFVARAGNGLELDLRSGAETLSVKVADAAGLDPTSLLNRYVRARGVGGGALSATHRLVLARLYVASGADLEPVQPTADTDHVPLMDISQVQSMPILDAKRGLRVRIRGIVTAANHSDRWLSLQDETRGVFVDLHALSNTIPATAELWEIAGHTAAGNFAPIVVAERMRRLGSGLLPEPARPSRNQLANGSLDVQWVEFQGLVSGIHSNILEMLLPEGPLAVHLEDHFEPELKPYLHAVVRIRGTLFAIWNADTREVQFGDLLIRNGRVNVDTPAPTDPFSAPIKTARDLLLFDAQATAFRPVKVLAQVLYSDPQGTFTLNEGMGLRLLPLQATALRRGELIEAVGYPEIGGPSPLLRQARIRKTGAAPLPRPLALAGSDWTRHGLDSTLVSVEANLVGLHSDQGAPVLELQAYGHLFRARMKPGTQAHVSLRLGTRVHVSGVFAETGRVPEAGRPVESFELLLESPADIRVLSEPSWWTLERLGTVVGLLLVVLVLAAAWITELRRKVEQRTAELQREIRERERAEHHQALEAERSRIARDLHDDLGSSLTEIGVLASTGQRASNGSADVFDAIAGKARNSIAALDVIVWAVDPEDNSLQSLADYLSGFVAEYLSHSNITCRFKIPVTFPSVMLEGRIRHDLFLAVKESLNNIVRHAQATEVEFGIAAAENVLEIVIADNGKGFDANAATAGNGVYNLHDRLHKLGGTCAVESHSGRGTTVRIRLPLTMSGNGCESTSPGGRQTA